MTIGDIIYNNHAIHWNSITHDEREIAIDNDYNITRIQLLDTIECGSSYEYIYEAYIPELEAWIEIKTFNEKLK